jgi:hypothetical protein
MGNRRPDPRVDPSSFPPERGEALRVDRVEVPGRASEVAVRPAPPKPEVHEAAPPLAPAAPAGPAAPGPHAVVSNEDARVAPLERRIQDNDWRGISMDLGPLSEAGKLPPNLGLLAALAHHEVALEGSHEAIVVGVRCVASLLRLPEDSAIAGVVARRMFRKNPVKFSERKAPPARVSILIVAVTLLLGGTVGWLMSGGWGFLRNLLRPG